MGDCISWCNPVFKRVDELPPVEVATRNHAYITPDNKAYILNENGDGFIQFSSDVPMDMVEKAIRQIVAETELNLETANLTLEGRTLSWSGTLNDGRPFNSSITLPEDKDTLYDDTELKNRIQELENKPDNGTVYDDTELTNRVESLENKVDNDTKYTAGTGLTLTNNQFSADMNVLATKADTDNLGNRIYVLEQEVDNDTIYDDSELRERIDELETKADYNTTYTIEVKDGVATLVGSNGTRNEIGKFTDNGTIYDDSELEAKINDILSRINNLGGKYTAGTGISISDTGVISLVDPVDNDTIYTAGNGLTLTDTEFAVNTTTDLVVTNGKLGIKPTYVQDNFYVKGTTLVKEKADGTKVQLDFTELISYIDNGDIDKFARTQYVATENLSVPASTQDNTHVFNLNSNPRTTKLVNGYLILSIPSFFGKGTKIIDGVPTQSSLKQGIVTPFYIPVFNGDIIWRYFCETIRIDSLDIELELSGYLSLTTSELRLSDVKLCIVTGKLHNSVEYKYTNFINDLPSFTRTLNGFDYEFRFTDVARIEFWGLNIVK